MPRGLRIGFAREYRIQAELGAFALAGQAATLTYTPASGGGFSDIPGPAGSASFSVSWDTPQLDGSGGALTDLSGYLIKYGTTSGVYPYQKVVSSSTATSTTVSSIAAGTYYVVMTAYDTGQNESYPTFELVKVAA